MSINHSVPKLPSIHSDKSLAVRNRKTNGEPCFSLPEVLTELGISRGILARLRKEGTVPEPSFYTGHYNKAFWHQSVIKVVKKKMEKL